MAAYLSAPSSELTRFFDSLDRFTGALAPVSNRPSDLFRDAATTFQAITTNPADYEATIAESPSTLAVSTDSLRAQQPFLVDFTTFGHYFSPGDGVSSNAALPYINPALEAGAITLEQTPTLNSGLQKVMSALKSLAQDPMTNVALNGLVVDRRYAQPDAALPRAPTRRYATTGTTSGQLPPGQRVGARPATATAQRVLIKTGNPLQPNSIGNRGRRRAGQRRRLGRRQPGHRRERLSACPAVRRGDRQPGQRRLRGRPARLPASAELLRPPASATSRPISTRPATRARRSPAARSVPAGETFSRNPQIGPQTPYNPSNP